MGVETPVLLDTGAQVSIISWQDLKNRFPQTKVNKIEDLLDPGEKVELTTANGTALPYLGLVNDVKCRLQGDIKGSSVIRLRMLVTGSILDHPIKGYNVLEHLVSTCDASSKTDEIIFALSSSLPNMKDDKLNSLVKSVRSANESYLCSVKAGKKMSLPLRVRQRKLHVE